MKRLWQAVLVIAAAAVLASSCTSYRACPEATSAITNAPPKACRLDGCTMAPDFNFSECCDLHDQAYWLGGTSEARAAADRTFRQCIADRDRPVLAGVYWAGVRLGGAGWLPTPWRWGFGWPYPETGADDAVDAPPENGGASEVPNP